MVQYIDAARYSISLAMYVCTSEPLGNAIVRAQKRGVRVHVIADKVMEFSTESKVALFLDNGL